VNNNVADNNSADMFIDEREFESRFLLTPNIQEEEDYRHLDKNLATTNLKSQFKEPEQARNILSALHTLSTKKYFYRVKDQYVDSFYEEKETRTDEQGNPYEVIVSKPIIKETIKNVNKYPKTYHKLKAKFYSFVTTSSARGGHLIKVSRTKAIRKEETLDDKTQNKTNFGFFRQKKKDSEDW